MWVSSECTGEMVERSWNSHGSYHGDLEVVLELSIPLPINSISLLRVRYQSRPLSCKLRIVLAWSQEKVQGHAGESPRSPRYEEEYSKPNVNPSESIRA